MVAYLGPRIGMTVASAQYMIWISVSQLPYSTPFLLMSAVEGVAAAVLWNVRPSHVL